jgi:subtilisin family serine protease
MAAPHVAGVVALMESATDEDLQPQEIETAVRTAARNPTSRSTITPERYGNGIIDTRAALNLVTGPPDFVVTNVSAPGTIPQNNSYNISATVVNSGEKLGKQNTAYRLIDSNGTQVLYRSTEVELRPDSNTKINMTISTNETNSLLGQYTQQVTTANDSRTTALTVSAPPSVAPGILTANGKPATDPDGDGIFEDINGDGVANLQDLKPFFNVVRPAGSGVNNPAFLDLTGDGKADLQDFRPFFDEVRPPPA